MSSYSVQSQLLDRSAVSHSCVVHVSPLLLRLETESPCANPNDRCLPPGTNRRNHAVKSSRRHKQGRNKKNKK